jgi:hypothetical protein
MIRSFALAAALCSGFTMAAFAADTAVPQADSSSASFTAGLNYVASEQTARKILIGRGYTQVSDLTRSEDGRWTGTAMKDGKVVMVGVDLPPKPAQQPATN